MSLIRILYKDTYQMHCHQNTGPSHNLLIAKKSFQNVAHFIYIWE